MITELLQQSEISHCNSQLLEDDFISIKMSSAQAMPSTQQHDDEFEDAFDSRKLVTLVTPAVDALDVMPNRQMFRIQANSQEKPTLHQIQFDCPFPTIQQQLARPSFYARWRNVAIQQRITTRKSTSNTIQRVVPVVHTAI